MNEILKSILETDLDNENNVDEVLKAGKISDKGAMAVKGALKLLSAYKDELPQNIMNTLAELSGYGYPAPTEKAKAKEQPTMPCKKADGTLDLTGVPDEVKPIVESLWKEHESAIAKTIQLEETLKKEKDERIKKEYIEKASALDSLNIKADDLGIILKDIAEKSPENLDKIMEVLKSANEVVKQSEIFKEVGSSANSNNTAWGKIENLAKTIVQKDATMTQAQAISKVLEENPDLYNEYLNEGVK